MTNYYISPDGSDASAGTSVGTAIKTLTKLQTLLASGDTAYFEAGLHADHEVIFSQSGADSANRIKLVGDLKGEHFAKKGLVLLSSGGAQPVAPFNLKSSTYFGTFSGNFYHFENLVISNGGTGTSFGMLFDHSYGHYFYRCQFLQTSTQEIVHFDFTSTTGDVTEETVFESCVLGNYIKVTTPFTAAPSSAKLYFKNCLGFPSDNYSLKEGMVVTTTVGTVTNYLLGGLHFYHCTVVGIHLVATYASGYSNRYSDMEMLNCLAVAGPTRMSYYAVMFEGSSGDYIGNFSVLGGGDNNSNLPLFINAALGTGFIGGITDADYIRNFGASPYQMWELYSNAYAETFPISAGFEIIGECDRDIYGNLRLNSPRTWLFTEIGGTGGTDADAKWSSENLGFNFQKDSVTGRATCGVQGSNLANFLSASGVPNLMSDRGAIHAVKAIIVAYNYGGGVPATLGYEIHTAGEAELLAEGTLELDAIDSTDMLLNEVSVAAPSAGWNYPNIGTLEAKVWKADSVTSAYIRFQAIVLRYQVSGNSTPGAVQSYQRPIRDALEQYQGEDSNIFVGAGMQQIILPVPTAASYTISVPYKIDANYTGVKPTIEAKGMIGQEMQSAVATGLAGSWNTDLGVTVTPTEAGFVCVNVYSLDTSGIGQCWISSVTITAD